MCNVHMFMSFSDTSQKDANNRDINRLDANGQDVMTYDMAIAMVYPYMYKE